MPLVANRDHGQIVWAMPYNISSKGSFSELMLSFVLKNIYYMWRMYSEIPGFWNHQSVKGHPNCLYLHAGIIDAGAQTKIV